MARPLNAFDKWAVRSNLERIATGEDTAENTIARLRAGGYIRWADAVAAEIQKLQNENA